RKYGQSKFGWERFVNGFLDLLSLYFVGRFGKKPMHFFGMFGVIMFIVGFGSLAYLSWEKVVGNIGGISERPLFYFGILCIIVGSQLFLTGFLAEMISSLTRDRQSNSYQIEAKIGLPKAK
ncbi:MAG: glycosyltransferase, partial [Saprospiraceae bacterium]